MEIDWAQVKKVTLWHYDALIEKLLDVLSYGFVKEHYNHSMAEAQAYAERVRQGYLQHGREATSVGDVVVDFSKLDDLGVKNYLDLMQRVDTQASCEAFLRDNDFEFGELIQVLNYLLRWVLPFKFPVKELLDIITGPEGTTPQILKRYKIRSNLDVLENFRTKPSRAEFSREAGVPEATLLALVQRADISRLAYVRGKTIKHLCGGGYDTLDKIATADLEKMEDDMAAYYATLGKSFSDFKSVIPLDWMVGGAKILPRVVEA